MKPLKREPDYDNGFLSGLPPEKHTKIIGKADKPTWSFYLFLGLWFGFLLDLVLLAIFIYGDVVT